MTITKVIALSTVVLISSLSLAQSVTDALLMSQTIYQGTARSQAMGGAMSAMGCDYGAVTMNPAGLALYHCRGELTLTPALAFDRAATTYFDNTEKASKANINISNFNLVLSREASNYGTLRYWQIGFGVNRTNNFNANSTAKGFNPNSSIVDDLLTQADGLSISDIESNFSLAPAWNTYIIDTNDNCYTSPVPQGNIYQTRSLKTKGHADEWTLTGGLNLIDKIFLGMSIGIEHLSRESDYSFTEENANADEYFESWTNSEMLKTKGTGINIKIGMIVFPIRWLRIGIAYHSPTIYNLKDIWEPYATSLLNGKSYESSYDMYTSYNYDLMTPQKLNAGIAILFNDKGIVTADYEYTNNGKVRLSADDWDYTTHNDGIKLCGKRASNFRIGTEWALSNIFVRGGFAFYGSPYETEDGENIGNTLAYSAGLGIPLSRNFAFDIAYTLFDSKSNILPYKYEDISLINEHKIRHNIALSLKLKW